MLCYSQFIKDFTFGSQGIQRLWLEKIKTSKRSVVHRLFIKSSWKYWQVLSALARCKTKEGAEMLKILSKRRKFKCEHIRDALNYENETMLEILFRQNANTKTLSRHVSFWFERAVNNSVIPDDVIIRNLICVNKMQPLKPRAWLELMKCNKIKIVKALIAHGISPPEKKISFTYKPRMAKTSLEMLQFLDGAGINIFTKGNVRVFKANGLNDCVSFIHRIVEERGYKNASD